MEKLIGQNIETIEQYGHLDNQQKKEAKLGFAVRYYNFINEQTPDSSIILMPPNDIIKNTTGNYKFHDKAVAKGWVSYFVYPRRVVFEDEKNEYPELYKKVTHVAIINNWGYEKLNYNVSGKQPYTVLPIKKTQ